MEGRKFDDNRTPYDNGEFWVRAYYYFIQDKMINQTHRFIND